MKTLKQLVQEAQALSNACKSVNVKAALKIIKENSDFYYTYEERTGYKDTKPAGSRIVTSRKVVKYYSVNIYNWYGDVVFSMDSELQMHCPYTFTNWVVNYFKNI